MSLYSASELAAAYAKMLLEDIHNGKTYSLAGGPISQTQLADYLNLAFDTNLIYESLSVKDYEKERKAELGIFWVALSQRFMPVSVGVILISLRILR